MLLTEMEIKAAKAQAKEQKLPDCKGFFLLVKRSGAKLWRERYMFENRETLMSLDAYPEVSLRRAHEKHADVRRLRADGIDPTALRKAQNAASLDTFKTIAEHGLERQAKTRAPITITTARTRLETTLCPAFGNKSVVRIEAPDVRAVLRRVEAAGTVATTRRLQSLFSRSARGAIQIGTAKRKIILTASTIERNEIGHDLRSSLNDHMHSTRDQAWKSFRKVLADGIKEPELR